MQLDNLRIEMSKITSGPISEASMQQLDAMQKHVYAHCEGGDAKQAIAKLPIYKKACDAYSKLMGKTKDE